MTVNLYMTWETPYLPAVAGLTVEAWAASLFTHSPVGNPSAYPPAPSPDATTTTDASGNCELTGLTAATDYYISIIDVNNKPWFQFCPGAYLGNLSSSRRRWSINPDPSLVVPPTILQKGELVCVVALPNGGAGATVAWQTGPVTLALPHAIYDPYSASDGNGFTVPAELVGANLWVDLIAEYGGTTAAAELPTNTLAVVYQPQSGPAISLGQSILSIPGGSVSWAGSLPVAGGTPGYVSAVALGETFIAQPDVPSLGSGSSMYWGGDVSTTGRFTQMRIFTC